MDGTAIVITQGLFATDKAKTAHGLVRDSSRYRILAIIDSASAGQDAGVVLDGTPRGIPIYASITDFQRQSSEPAQYCLVGVAGKGGRIPAGMLEVVKEALGVGMNVVSGLHEFMGDVPELQALAETKDLTITDIRRPKPKEQLAFWTGDIRQVHSLKLAVLGIDCNVGKRTTARLLLHALREASVSAEMIYTGQTGWMQGNRYGFIFDSTYNDFISGELEAAMVQCYREAQPDVILLEGQSSLRNPSGPGGAEFLLSGQARHVVLQCAPGRTHYSGFEEEGWELPSVASEVELIRAYGAEVVALTLNTQGLSLEKARRYQRRYDDELGITTLLPIEDGMNQLVTAVQSLLAHRD
jgi:uncharacterized NAD-dependent epimerase/dehydratase family protein